MINAFWNNLTFVVQQGSPGMWHRVVDTARPSPDDFCEPGCKAPLDDLRYEVQARSIVVLVRPR
jgi:glycogen operon protein